MQIMKENMEVRIGRYLSGEMEGHEREGFEQEMAQDQSLRTLVEVDSRIWQLSSSTDSGNWNVDTAWNRFSEEPQPIEPRKQKPVRRMALWAVAASAVLLIGVYGLFFRLGSPVVYTYQESTTAPVALKDGSKIYLNKNAEVTVYPFTSSKRLVELKGEAFFEIAGDPSRPFVVNCGETVTEVFGTSFNIRQTMDQTLILVSSGKVIFSPADKGLDAAALTAGEAAVFKSGKVELIANPSPNVNAWRTHDLRFVKMPLSSVVEDISNYFDQEILIENEASKSCPITIPLAFKKPEINAVLRAVAVAINAEFVQEGNKFIIRGGRDCS
jgi:ferric-dicitrate binding protein FerR (iron transport regulator)